jgi:hypothetical protein
MLKMLQEVKKLSLLLVEKIQLISLSLYQWMKLVTINNVLCKPCTIIAMSCSGKDLTPHKLPEQARNGTNICNSSERISTVKWVSRLGDLEKIVIYYATYFALGYPFRVEEICSFVVYALNKMGISLEHVFDSYRQLYKKIHAACQRLAYPCKERKKDKCAMPRLLIHDPNTKKYKLNPEYHDVAQYIKIHDVLNRIVKRMHRNIHSTTSNTESGKDQELPDACCDDVVMCGHCPQEWYNEVFEGRKVLIRIVHSNAGNLIQLIKLVALLMKLLGVVFEALVACAVRRGELSKDDVKGIVKKAGELTKRVRKTGKVCFGYHKGVKGKNREKFSPLMTYPKAVALYSVGNAEPGMDISIPCDVGKEIESFTGFRFFEKSYLVTAEHLTKTGAMRRWRERMKNLLDYIKNHLQ